MPFGIDNAKSYLRELLQIQRHSLVACGYEKKTVIGTASGLGSIPTDATFAIIKLESNKTGYAVRFLETGTQPLVTTTDGIGFADGDTWDITNRQNLENFRCIEAIAGTNTLHVQYYK
jgi:hypothetical protein